MMRNDEMQSVVSEAKRSRFTTIPKLADEDVGYVWDSVSEYIGRNMTTQKGVAVPTLGIFTFSQRKIDVGNNKIILIQRPVFILSEKFAKTHALHATKLYTDGQVPILPLNFSAISQEMDFDRDIVERCVKEMLLALSRSVQAKKNVEFTFPTIGKLIIKDSKVKMKFYKDFLQSIDASGSVTNAMKNRPETSDSVISRSATPSRRPATSGNTVYLPRINPGEDLQENQENANLPNSPCLKGKPAMPMIVEECAAKDCAVQKSVNCEMSLKSSQVDTFLPSERQLMITENGKATQGPGSPARLKTAPSIVSSPAEANLFQKEVTFDGSKVDLKKLRQTPTALKSVPAAFGNFNESDSFVPIKTSRNKKVFDKTCSNCLHDAGQELCYLCYQRDRRNIPVYLHEERRRKELEEDRLLQQYQHIKDYEAILKDQDNKAVGREEAQKIAAFNLGVAEAIKTKKHEKPSDFGRSFIFYKRSVSPSFSLSQQKYQMDLAEQVKQRERNVLKTKKEREFFERLEQVQLAEDLTAQRQQYLKNKRLQSEEYKKALDTQIYIKKCIERQFQIGNERPLKSLMIPRPNVIQPFQDVSSSLRRPDFRGFRQFHHKQALRFKPLPLSGGYPDSEQPYFGKHDIDYNKMLEKRRQARNLFEDQLNAAAEKKKSSLLHDLKTQREEALMLTRAKTDLLEETIHRNRDRVNVRRDLEDTWLQAAKLKKSREFEEKQSAQSPGVLLHEQCSRYRRCKNCERKLPNCGESSVWCESRYLSGSRIMV